MNKQPTQKGVQIVGLDRSKPEEWTSKSRNENREKAEQSAKKMKGKENTRKVNATEEENEAEKNTQENLTDKPTQGPCKPRVAEVLRVVLTDPAIQAYRDHMTEHAVICRFIGLWPTERALCQWIKQHWKPKGHVNLHLGAKGFFTVVFSNLEDLYRVFDGCPYFFASAGLYMKPWKPNFVPEKETFKKVPVSIHLFELPIDYWDLAALKPIGDKLGTFIKASEATLQRIYTSCARICVEMDVPGALHEGLWLEYRDEDYFQAIDYEQILFHCRKCHENGHLIREFPLNKTTDTQTEEQEGNFKDTFTRPRTRQRENRRRPNKTSETQANKSNAFEVLETEKDLEHQNKENKNSGSNKATTEAATKGVEEDNPNSTKKIKKE
eukprot:PITA_30247